MKKLLSLLGAIGLTATTGATVVACGQSNTQASVANDVVTSQNYQVAAQNVQTSSMQSDGDLIASFENQLRGYLNPIFAKLVGQNESNIAGQYEIQGITADDIKRALEAIEKGPILEGGVVEVPISGITVVAKDGAQHITGSVVLPTVTMLSGTDITKLFLNAEKILVESEGYEPTLQEILDKLNEELANSTPDPITLTPGHIVFKVDKSSDRKVFVSGNGLYYGQFNILYSSTSAKDIAEIITPAQNDLGQMGFIARPSDEQLFNSLIAKFGPDFNAENLEIAESGIDKTVLLGRNQLKGEAVVQYERTIFNLENIINTNLGAVDEKPTDLADLVKKVNELNPGLGLTTNLVTLAGSIGDTSASIAAVTGSEIVNGTAKIEWTIEQLDLSAIISKTDLGALAGSATKADVLTAVNELNGTKLTLNDVQLTISNTEVGKSALITASENSARYIGSVTVNWTVKPVLNQANLQQAISNLSSKNLLDFVLKPGLTIIQAQTLITNKIKELLSKDYWINSPELFNINFSEFPDLTWLGQPSGNIQWVASPEATMSFTLDNSGTPVIVKAIWRIMVVA